MSREEKIPVDLEMMRSLDPIANPLWAWGAASIGMGLFKLGAEVTFHNLEALPQDRPVIVAMNHTQFCDFLPLRAPLLFHGHHFVSWVKPRAYRDPKIGGFLRRTGNIPVCSKGYIVASDFFTLCERAPSEEEYAALNAYIKDGAPWTRPDPEGIYERLATTPRTILGRPFRPEQESWREAVRETFYALMRLTLDKTERCVERGDHVHIYPQGTIAPRLIPGKVGVIETALALDLPILAVGVSGCREAFIGASPRSRRGERIIVRFDETLYHVPPEEFGPDYRPFHPDDSARYHDRLQHHVDRVMDRLSDVLEPGYRWAEAERQLDEVKRGVDRFF